MKRIVVSSIIVVMCVVIGLGTQARGENGMITQGSTVKINYVLTVDGEVKDSSEGREPLQYVQGEGKLIPGLERELEGMQAGDSKTVVVVPADAYGDHVPEAIQEVDKSNFPPDEDLQVGGGIQGQNVDGRVFQGVITEVKENSVMVDFNHPLAGKELTFDVTVVEVA